jgi:hypothetical protein
MVFLSTLPRKDSKAWQGDAFYDLVCNIWPVYKRLDLAHFLEKQDSRGLLWKFLL